MNTLIFIVLYIGLGVLIGYLFAKEKARKLNQEIEQQEQTIQLKIKDLDREYSEKRTALDQELKDKETKWEHDRNEKFINWQRKEADLQSQVSGLESQIIEKRNSISELDKQATESAKNFEAKVYDLMSVEFEQKAIAEINHCKYLSQQAQEEYERMMREDAEEYLSRIEELTADYERIVAELNDARAKADAAVEVNKRAELERQEKDFYKLQLSDIDVEEIKRIRSIEPYLRKKEPLNKVIWKVYYEKPYTDLIGRVVGQNRKTGIYKITNLENGMCYIGQAVDIAERWKQHIKRGVGADPPTQNKLYPTMLEIGVENFTFEIIEQCDGSKLNEREQYWQNFYHAKDFGYSIK